MHKVFTLQGRGEEAGDAAADQQLEGGIRDQQAALHTSAVFDGCPDVLISELSAEGVTSEGVSVQRTMIPLLRQVECLLVTQWELIGP